MNFKLTLTVLFLCFYIFSNGQHDKHLVGYYPFEDGQAEDYSRRGGHGKIQGNLQTIKGINGEALRFDGGNHKIIFDGKVNRFLRGKRDFSISFYFRSDDLNQRSILLGKRNKCNGFRMFDLRLSKGKIGVELYERERPQIKNNVRTTVPDRGWHHYVYVRKGNSAQFYIDGNLVAKRQIPHIIHINDLASFAINNSPCKGRKGTGNLIGAIDELKIFKTALRKRHVRNLFEQHPLPPLPKALKTSTTPTIKKSIQDSKTRQNNIQPDFPLPKPIDEKISATSSDKRLQAVFGKYTDLESQSTLILDTKKFILTIKKPTGYEAEELVYEGKYKIENGDLYLLQGEILLKNSAGEISKKIQYREKIISDLHENEIDLFAFETRLELRK